MNLALPEVIFRQVLAASLLGSILAVFAWIVQRIGGNRLGPAWRYALWLVVLVRLLSPVLPESAFSLFNAPRWLHLTRTPPKVEITFTDGAPLHLESLQPPITARTNLITAIAEPDRQKATPFQFLTLVWLAGTVALIARLAAGSCWLRLKLRQNNSAPSPVLIHAMAEARTRLRTFWNPRLVETSIVDSPGLFGCVRPKLLVPPGMANRLTPIELRHIFLHELAHLKRGDLWTNLGMSLVHALHWFNPLVWFILRRLRLERELACDALVLQASHAEERYSYGETILKLLERIAPHSPFPALVGILEEKHAAASRLSQIATYPSAKTISRKAGIFVIAMFVLAGLSNAQTQQSALRSKNSSPTTVAEASVTPDVSMSGIAAVQREYDLRKARVDELQKQLDELRIALKISERGDEYYSGAPERLQIFERDRAAAQIRYAQEKKLSEALKSKSRDEQRKIIPTVAPDAAMDRYLADLGKAEQQLTGELIEKTTDHPDVVRLRQVITRIDRQIDERIEGIIAGLDLQVAQNKALIDELAQQIGGATTMEAELRKTYAPYFETKRELEREQRALDTIHHRMLAAAVDTHVPSPEENNDVRHTVGKNVVATFNATASTNLVQDARLLMEMKKLDEAETKLKEVLEIEPDNRAARYYLGQLYAIKRGQHPASDDRVVVSAGRSNIVRKIQTLRIPEFKLKADTKLNEAIVQLSRLTREADPNGTGVNFIFSSSAETLVDPSTGSKTERASGKVSDFVIPAEISLSNGRILDVIERLVDLAQPPGGEPPTKGMKYSIEDYALVFSESERPALYTRSYRVNPNIFAENIQAVLGKKVEDNRSLLEGIGGLFSQAGASFSSPATKFDSAPGDAMSGNAQRFRSTKALFYNERTGVLMARGTLADLDIVEHVLQSLNSAPPQVLLEARVIEMKQEAAYNMLSEILTNAQGVQLSEEAVPRFESRLHLPFKTLDSETLNSPSVPSANAGSPPDLPYLQAVIPDRVFRKLLKEIPGAQVLASPKVTTLSNRAARVSVEPGPTVEFLPVVEFDGQNIRLSVDLDIPSDEGRKLEALRSKTKETIPDGHTLMIWPKQDHQRTVILFITATLIDPAGNRIHPRDEAK